ncbi:TetR/AcrR family transcriptional regulator [Streptomyces sp. NBC_00247]|uniref:TetR/AcrR family transcriptional regulator n=1 Tax=Streptomyces sp. NBC_00247 TaxID=2975689 RepID=UPI002E2DCD6F|nr:helix-turn-helix domain-containing protein [Streptomyces sp. NBC_00247]
MAQGLTSKGAATRQRIVDGAAQLMRERGPEVSLDEIRAATGTSKSQLFHYFPEGRSALLVAVARHEAEAILADQQPHLGRLTSWAAWDAWRDAVLQHYRIQGRHCPLNVLTGQLAGDDPEVRAVAEDLMDRWQAQLAAGVRDMQDQGLMSAAPDAERAGESILAAVQGGAFTLIATGRLGPLESALDLALDHLRVGDAA